VKIRALSIALGLSALLVACGDRDDGDPAATLSQSTTGATTTASPSSTQPAGATGPAEFEGARALEHVRVLSEDIGPRVSGTAAEDETAEYLAEQFGSYGYDVEIMEFTFSGDRFNRVGSVGDDVVDHEALALVGSPGGQVAAESVWVGLADEAGIGGRDLTGKIAVATRGQLPFAEKYENVKAAGAAALVIVNSVPGPVSGDLGREATIPVVAVSGEVMPALRPAAEAGASLTVDAPGGDATEAVNVIARPSADATCTVLVGGHHDTVPAAPGANDNGSGTGTIVELARAFAADGTLDPGLCFATFGAEESGLYGSQALAARMQEDGELPAYMVNIDVAGIGGGVAVTATEGLGTRVLEFAETLGIDAELADLPANTGSDHASFRALGVETVFIWSDGDFPTIHTPEDQFEDIQVEELERVGDLNYEVIEDLVAEVARGQGRP
jgi:aminopeptidase YwaD